MKAFITGATGCVGRHLAVRLRSDGWSVTGTGRRPDVGDWLTERGIDFQAIDVADATLLRSAIRGHDVVFHCAALSSAWGAWSDFHRVNVLGTQNVIDACRQTENARLVHVSSSSVYFAFQDRYDVRETDPLPAVPVNAYAESKRFAEQCVLHAMGEGLPSVILRPRAVIGVYDTGLAPRLARVARRGFLPLLRGGTPLVDVTCVENLVEALVLAASTQKGVGRCFNITNGDPIPLREMLQRALDALDLQPRLVSVPVRPALAAARMLESVTRWLRWRKEPVVTAYTLGLLTYGQTLNIDAARQDLGYRPQFSLAEGLEKVRAWWSQQSDV